jgi:hypothetical protein
MYQHGFGLSRICFHAAFCSVVISRPGRSVRSLDSKPVPGRCVLWRCARPVAAWLLLSRIGFICCVKWMSKSHLHGLAWDPQSDPAADRSVDRLAERTRAGSYAASRGLYTHSTSFLCIRNRCRRLKVRCKTHPPMGGVEELVVTAGAAAGACFASCLLAAMPGYPW